MAAVTNTASVDRYRRVISATVESSGGTTDATITARTFCNEGNWQFYGDLNQVYYSDCLQSHIEQFELAMDEGLGLTQPKGGRQLGVELDLDALLRMDTATQVKTLAEGIGGALMTPNEARRKVDLKPLKGGDFKLEQFEHGMFDKRAREIQAQMEAARQKKARKKNSRPF